jgi:hypothetical protein
LKPFPVEAGFTTETRDVRKNPQRVTVVVYI